MTEPGFEDLLGRAENDFRTGNISSAQTSLKEATGLAPDTIEAHFQLGSMFYLVQEFDAAINHFQRATTLSPDVPEPWQNMGLALESLQRFDEALAVFNEAAKLAPDWLDPWKSAGGTLIRLDRATEAIVPLERAFELAPNDSQTAFFLGNSYLATSDGENAVRVLAIAAALSPGDAETVNNYGQALEFAGDDEDAIVIYARAREIAPDFARPILNRARLLVKLNRGEEAVEGFKRVIALNPDEADAYVELGSYLQNNQRNEEAVEVMLKAIELADDDPVLVNNLAVSLSSIGQFSNAKIWYDKLIELVPNRAAPLVNYATMMEMMEQSDEALIMLQEAAKIDPDYAPTYSLLVHGKLKQCKWSNLEALVTRIIEDSKREIAEGQRLSALPFVLLALPVPLDIRLAASRQLATAARASVLGPEQQTPFDHSNIQTSGKIKIGYMSPDFRMHSVGMCFRSILAAHDREKFEVFGYHMALKPDDETTDFFRQSFDHFHDIRQLSTSDAARQIHDDGIQILVDLAGHTRGSRMEVLALKPAPVQAHYLGYGATTGADYIDYLITDDTVMDKEAAHWCSETLAFLPKTFMPPLGLPYPAHILNRADEGLPEDGFVFANFSGHYKIDPDIFSVWMRLLKRTPGSVLWLVSGSAKSVENLRQEASARGIDPDRLIIAKRCSHEVHLARHHLADLCLDNYFHAGGATTLEALWCDLPVLTLRGLYPNSRTGAGMLKAAGLPELVARDLVQYAEMAHDLARSPERLKALRQRLSQDKQSNPLFDSTYFVAHLESVLTEMWQTFESGNPPHTIRV
jgi:protein O-GlcNAc transferase